MVYRSSFSQHMSFVKCPRMWFFQKVKKIPVIQDMCYAHAGNVIHKTLERHYNGELKTLEERKKFFSDEWGRKGLDETKLRLKKDEYALMIINGVNLNKTPTTNELRIYYPEVVAFLDGVDTNSNEIWDYKSSKRSVDNEEEYLQQLKVYCWLYFRKFGRLPDKAIVYYLRYSGTKGELVYTPTTDDAKETEVWYTNILLQMEEVILSNTIPKRCEDCFIFCPYKNLCDEHENLLKYTLYISGNYIHLDGYVTELLGKGIIKNFSYELKNAYYIKKSNPYARTIIEFWNPIKRTLPFCFKNKLVQTLKNYAEYKKKELNLEVVDNRIFNEEKIVMPEKFINGKELRDYQREAVDVFIKKKIGILEIGTGGGKTLVAAEIIRRLSYNTLFVVDKIELLRQTKKVLEESLGIKVGQIGEGKNDIKHVTIATIQTLVKNFRSYSQYLSTVRLAIFDETHKAAAFSYQKLGNYLTSTEYRLGISGTAYRDDGNDLAINAATGFKIFDLGSKVLIDRGWLVKPRIVFIKDYIDKETIKIIEDNIKIGLINETANYGNYYGSFISGCNVRNDIIKKLVDNNQGKKILILTRLIDHGKYLKQLIPESDHLYGSTNKIDREKMFNEFTNGNLNVLVSTISIFSEGIDVPALDVIINAGANKGSVKTIQMLGRVLRKLEGKEEATYFDFIDETKFFRLASYARKRALIKESHEIEIIKTNELYS